MARMPIEIIPLDANSLADIHTAAMLANKTQSEFSFEVAQITELTLSGY